MAGDPYWNSVVLALHMDGANASTAFTDLKGHVMTAAGNAQISTAQSKFGGASVVFDGAGDYLTTPSSADYDFGSGDFTIELWYRPASVAAGAHLVSTTEGLSKAFLLAQPSADPSKLFAAAGNSDSAAWEVAITSSVSLVVSTWHHIAFTRSGSDFRLFVNGALAGSATYSGTVYYGSVPLYIGSAYGGASSYVNGYLDDLRITKGVARYTANFTVPALAFPNAPAMISGTVKDSTDAFAPRAVRAYRKSDGALSGAATSHATTGVFSIPALDASPHYALVHDSDADPYWNSVVLATHFNTDTVIDPYMSSVVLGLHMEGANASTVLQDVTGKTITAVDNAQVSTTQAKFGNSSAYFDGTGDYLSVPRLIAGGAFTAECWFRVNAVGVQQVLFSQYGVSGGAGRCGATVDAAGYPTFFVNGLTGGNLTLTHASTVPALSWHHMAVVRDASGYFTLYVNGVGGTAELRTGDLENTPFEIGRLGNATLYLTGHIDDLRVTTVARYTANFTPPTVPFSSFKDLTGKDLMVNGVPSISTSTKKYGDGAVYFNGSGGLMVSSNPVLSFGAGDFTVEMHLNLGNTATATVLAMGLLTNQFQIYSTGSQVLIYMSSSGVTWDFVVGAVIVNSFATATWYHLAVCRRGPSLLLFANGVLVKTVHVGVTAAAPAGVIGIGSTSAGIETMSGYIDDLRITKGVARYTADFTPPERSFPGAMTAGVSNALIYDDLTPV